MKTIINENQRGLFFKNGKFIKMLVPGKYSVHSRSEQIRIRNLSEEFKVTDIDISVFLKDEQIKKELAVVDVKDETLVLHYINGKYNECLTSGKYAFWTVFNKHEFKEIDISKPEVNESVPKFIFSYIPKEYFVKVEVLQYQKAVPFHL